MNSINLHNATMAVVVATTILGIVESGWSFWAGWTECRDRREYEKRSALSRRPVVNREMTASESADAAKTHERLLAAGWSYDGFCGLYTKPAGGRIRHGL